MPQPTVDASGVDYAGFWRRVAAFVADFAVVCFIEFLLALVMLFMFGFFRAAQRGSVVFLSLVILWLVVAWLYSAIMESSSKQATVGKEGLGIVVTDMAGGRISFGKATVRYLGKIVSALTVFVGFIMIGFTANKQALHDRIAGSAVVVKEEALHSPVANSHPPAK